jgi:hypothetical protein
MAGDNDVSRLLASIGAAQDGYQRVDTVQPSGPDVQGTPLIDAVFGRDSAPPKAAASSDRVPPFMAQPAGPAGPPDIPAAPVPPKPAAMAPEPDLVASLFPGGRSAAPRGSRSLRDIREILSPARGPGAARSSQPSGLTGLFDRLGQ